MRYIQIVLYDGLVDGDKNCEVVMFGGTSNASAFIHLDLQEFYELIHFIEMQPHNSFLIIGENRFEARTKWCDTGKGDGTKVGFITFTLYDVKKEWGYSQVEFVDSELSWQLSEEKEHIKNSIKESPRASQIIDNTLSFHLSIDDNDKSDYYYYSGHICIETHFLKMERDLLIEISELQQFRHRISLLFENGNLLHFCPLGEMIDLSFHVKDGVIYADGEISDFAYCPTTDYVFHAIVNLDRFLISDCEFSLPSKG